ncbi:CinA family protein [Actinomyces minihominis]|uniref:CinA family protein n=1 Tax=Actinomyces minihominis TaxID=2002838 RepID=UPI000C08CAFC|nr:CinA family protein [Actinomyces minihominis]
MVDQSHLLQVLTEQGWTIATAESLTGGALCATLVDTPGISSVLLGGVVAYATDLKADILGVDRSLLQARGPVCAEVANQMAQGVRSLCASDFGISTTGVAGPGDSPDGPQGLVFVGVVGPTTTLVEKHMFSGSRSQVRHQAIEAALALLKRAVQQEITTPGR